MYQKQLQPLLGKLLYITKCVRISRPFLNHMLDVLRAADKLTKISLSMDFKRDLNWFQKFLPRFNGKASITHRPITEEIELDASLQGLGARWGHQVYTIAIPMGYEHFTIVHLLSVLGPLSGKEKLSEFSVTMQLWYQFLTLAKPEI